MHLILSGGGSGSQAIESYKIYTSLLDKSKPILYIPLAWIKGSYEDCLSWLKSEFSIYGITNIEMLTDKNQFSNLDLSKYNSIFIGGGNTYKLLNDLKESKGYELIKDYLINSDGIVYGGSAGAIIFGKDIRSCNICSDDENNYSGLDTTGFNLLNNKSLACHYASKNKKDIHDVNIKEFNKNGYDVITLTEEEYLYIK